MFFEDSGDGNDGVMRMTLVVGMAIRQQGTEETREKRLTHNNQTDFRAAAAAAAGAAKESGGNNGGQATSRGDYGRQITSRCGDGGTMATHNNQHAR